MSRLTAEQVLEYLSVHARRAEEDGRYKEMIAMDAAAEEIERLQTCGVIEADRKSTRLNSSHIPLSRMPSSA